MPGNQKSVFVKVTLRSDGDPPEFDITSKDLSKDGKDNLIFENDGHPGFVIHFELDDGGLGYLFPPNKLKHEALWSKLGANACPKTECNQVLHVIGVSPDRKTLNVLNPNPPPAQGEFGYSLRVTKDGGKNYLLLDPGGVNGNGPTQPFVSQASYSTTTLLLIGAVTGSLLTLGVQALR